MAVRINNGTWTTQRATHSFSAVNGCSRTKATLVYAAWREATLIKHPTPVHIGAIEVDSSDEVQRMYFIAAIAPLRHSVSLSIEGEINDDVANLPASRVSSFNLLVLALDR